VRTLKTTLAITLLAALATASSAGARSTFGGNVCHLLTAKQVTAVQGVSPKCTNAKPMAGPGSKIYVGNWSGKTPRSPRVQVTVSLYTDQGALQLATRNLGQGLPGTPRKVARIGSAAYEATGGFSTGVRFAKGKYVVLVSVDGIGKPSWSNASVEKLARAVAARF
jgi:hypothetical protein